MPIIRIDWDDEKLNQDEILILSNAIQRIVSETTKIEDVFVYANSSQVKVKIAPIEIFVEMTSHKIKDRKELITSLKTKLVDWKRENNFPHPINLTLIPRDWDIEIGI